MLAALSILIVDKPKNYNDMRLYFCVLPISPKDLVLLRYLFKLAVSVIVTLMLYVMVLAGKQVNAIFPINMKDVYLSICTLLMVTSVVTPFNYLKKENHGLIAGLLMVVFAFTIIADRGSYFNDWGLLMFIVIGVVMVPISSLYL